jgi:subtilase family serine protease
MDADPTTGMLVGQTQSWSDGTYYGEYRIGGTSLACPLMAGIMALAENVHGSPIGLANPSLYAMGYTGMRDVRAVGDALHDAGLDAADGAAVRVEFANGENAAGGYLYSLRFLDYETGTGQSISTRDGYDTVTGIGTPNGAAFLAAFE